ncbi:MAG TPA: hypothetical protein VI756_10400 [Blastocatellia bacterium]
MKCSLDRMPVATEEAWRKEHAGHGGISLTGKWIKAPSYQIYSLKCECGKGLSGKASEFDETHLCFLHTILESRSFLAVDEQALQRGLATVFQDQGIEFWREYDCSPKDRIDFVIGSIGLEVKVDGSRADVVRQLQRYAQYFDALILVTTRSRHQMPKTLGGKPLETILLRGAGF